MYVLAGFHKVQVSIRALRAEAVGKSDEPDSSDEEEETGWNSPLLLLISLSCIYSEQC